MVAHSLTGVNMFQTGDLLIAPPAMSDPRFRKAVLLITYHGLNGTQAICLNKPAGDTTVNDLLEGLGAEVQPDQALYWGGPTAPSTLWMLHSSEWSCNNTMNIGTDWAVSSSTAMFGDMRRQGHPHHNRFYVGLSSWSPGQLDAEMEGDQPWTKASSWLVARAPGPGSVFDVDVEDLWHWACDLSAEQTVKGWMA